MEFPGPCDPCHIQAVIGVCQWQCKDCDTILVDQTNWTVDFQAAFRAHVVKTIQEAMEAVN